MDDREKIDRMCDTLDQLCEDTLAHDERATAAVLRADDLATRLASAEAAVLMAYETLSLIESLNMTRIDARRFIELVDELPRHGFEPNATVRFVASQLAKGLRAGGTIRHERVTRLLVGVLVDSLKPYISEG